MLINIAISNLQDPSPNNSNNDSLAAFGNNLLKKSKLTKGMSFILLGDLMVLLFVLSYSKIPYINDKVTLSSSDIKEIIYIVIGITALFMFLYALPEVIGRFKNMDKLDD